MGKEEESVYEETEVFGLLRGRRNLFWALLASNIKSISETENCEFQLQVNH